MMRAGALRKLLETVPDDAVIMVEFGNYLKAAESVVNYETDGANLIAVSTEAQGSKAERETRH